MRPWWKELRLTLILALPIMLGQLGQMMMPVIDAAMIGRLGVTPLAAVAFGTLVVWIPLIAGFGLCVAVHVLVASAHSSGRREEAGEVLRHGLWLGALYGIICGVGLQCGLGLLNHIPHIDQDVINAAKPFIVLMGWSTVPVLGFTVVKNYCEAQNRAWLPLGVLAGSLVLNVLLNWIFIYGHLGAPAMGVAGAGLATLLARAAAFITLLICARRSAILRPIWKRGAWAWLAGERVWRMLALGGPSGVQILFEVGMFNFATLLAGMLGRVTLDAHQIALNVASLAFMVPLGLSMATGIRVSHAAGLGEFSRARRIGWSSIACAVGFMAVYAVGVMGLREILPHLFLQPNSADARAVLELASKLLIWAAAFAVFDGAQVTTLGTLRGLRDVRVPTVLSFTGYWLVCAPLAWYLGWRRGWGGPGVWAGLFGGVMVVAILLMARFEIISRRRATSAVNLASAQNSP
jgi:MATE family multidrug resistance protein